MMKPVPKLPVSVERLNLTVRSLSGDQRGVTGLETAIILIAFVVVASVFAFTVLSTGIFSAERGKETIYAGLKEARSTIELKGSVIANGVTDKTLSTADSVWSTSLGATVVTVTRDTTDKKEGTSSADIVIAASSSTGLVFYDDPTAPLDLSATDSISLWIKAASSTVLGEFELILDNSTACGSSLENVDLPALVAGTWKLATIAITDNSDMTAIECVGLNVATDNGGQTFNLDEIVGQGQATNLIITLTNALSGEPIDVTEPADSDDDADSDSIHSLILTFSDKNQVVRDVYWTQVFVGKNDGDNLIESGEKVELTVKLKGLSNTYPVTGDTRFDLELRPEDGDVVVIQRTMPDIIDLVMNLN